MKHYPYNGFSQYVVDVLKVPLTPFTKPLDVT